MLQELSLAAKLAMSASDGMRMSCWNTSPAPSRPKAATAASGFAPLRLVEPARAVEQRALPPWRTGQL
jgi:predicted lipoprotein